MFISTSNDILNADRITYVDCANYFETDTIIVWFVSGGKREVSGLDALNVIMKVCPSWYEGHRGKYARWSFAIHNLIAHPVLQILHWMGLSKLGVRLHDWLIPSTKRLKR